MKLRHRNDIQGGHHMTEALQYVRGTDEALAMIEAADATEIYGEDELEVQFVYFTDRFGLDYPTEVVDYIRIGTQEFHNSEIINELD